MQTCRFVEGFQSNVFSVIVSDALGYWLELRQTFPSSPVLILLPSAGDKIHQTHPEETTEC